MSFAKGGFVPLDRQDGLNAADYTVVIQAGTRAAGYGDYTIGHRFSRPTIVTEVVLEAGTADASGTSSVALYKGTGGVSGTALTGGTPADAAWNTTAASATTTLTGEWAFAAGEYLQVRTVSVGTTPGARLRAHVKASYDSVA